MPKLFSQSHDVQRAMAFVLFALPPVVFVCVAPLVVPDTNDDTFIFLRIARNMLQGYGPVYNPGERVEVYSSPLWLALLTLTGSLFSVVQEPARFAPLAQGLSTLCVVGTYVVLFLEVRRHTKSMMWALWAGWCLLLFPISLVWARAGMDASLAALLVACLLGQTAGRFSSLRWHRIYASLLVWTRPEGIAWVLVLSVLRFRSRGLRESAKDLLWPALSFATLLTTRRAWFGQWLPNTYFAKRGRGVEFYQEGASYALQFLVEHFAWLIMLGAAVAMLRLRGAKAVPGLASCLAFCLVQVGLVALEGGDFLWYQRLLYPVLAPLLLVGASAFAGISSRSTSRMRLASAAVALAYFGLTATEALSGELVVRAQEVHRKHRSEALAAQIVASTLGPDESLAVGPAGRLVYEAAPRAAYDFYGLVELDVARAPAIAGRPGHRRFSAELLLARRPDFVVFTTSPSWSPPCAFLGPGAFPPVRPSDSNPIPTNLLVHSALSQGYQIVLVPTSAQSAKRLYLPLLASPEAFSRIRRVPLLRLHELCSTL